MRIALAQLNPVVGDVRGNAAMVVDAVGSAREAKADLVVCPEMVLLGYPPRDLLLREGVVRGCEEAVGMVAAAARGVTVAVGHPRRAPGGTRGIRNSVSICRDGAVLAVYDKRLLPGYDVFDEDRYFDPGETACVVTVAGRRVGILVCEDLWQADDVEANPRYAVDPVQGVLDAGCDVLVTLNASPFIIGKHARHLARLRAVARRCGVPIVAVNQTGAHDDLVFDGRSAVVSADGTVARVLPAWRSAVSIVDDPGPAPAATAPPPAEPSEDIFNALVVAVRDYVRKTGHDEVLVGLSGGIDSAVTAAIAAAALGPENVTGVMMPSRYSSEGSLRDARALAEAMGIGALDEIPIESAHRTVRDLLAPFLGAEGDGIVDENVQARIRGLLLMARANASGALLLATGNKSELAVGYATLYGDMCGALAVLGDVTKRRVYDLARWINANPSAGGFDRAPIPSASITKPPSAELRPDQTDQDTLPPYDVLDEIIERRVEQEQSTARIIAETGFDADLVHRTLASVDRAEHKRYQAALIPKVTHRTFGRGRPMPLVVRDRSLAAPDAPAAAPPASAESPT